MHLAAPRGSKRTEPALGASPLVLRQAMCWSGFPGGARYDPCVPIERCSAQDVAEIGRVINDAAQAYRGVIPADRWHEPYMPQEELRGELEAGVVFWAFKENQALVGVMGLQQVQDVALIRHAYTRTASRGRGIGGALLEHLKKEAKAPLLVGTWKVATWAIRFYEKRGFSLVGPAEKTRLLRRYWSIPERQIEESVVLKQ